MAEYRLKKNGTLVVPSTFRDDKSAYYGSNEVELIESPTEKQYKEELFHKYFGQVVQGLLSGGYNNTSIGDKNIVNEALNITKEMMKHI